EGPTVTDVPPRPAVVPILISSSKVMPGEILVKDRRCPCGATGCILDESVDVIRPGNHRWAKLLEVRFSYRLHGRQLRYRLYGSCADSAVCKPLPVEIGAVVRV